MLVRAKADSNFSHSPAVIDVLADEWDEDIMNMSVEVLRVGLIVGVIVGVYEGAILMSSGGKVGFVVDIIITEVCVLALPGAVLAFEVLVPVSNALNWWVGVLIEVLVVKVIALVPDICIDVLTDVKIDM